MKAVIEAAVMEATSFRGGGGHNQSYGGGRASDKVDNM